MKKEIFNLSNSFVITTDMEATAQTMTKDIKNLDGINDARVDISENTLTVDYNENKTSSSIIKDKLRRLNYLD